jgi:histidyl-tRNA synthetase
MATFQALPGFRDFFPAEMAVRRHVERAWHAASRAAGFQEIEGPPLESLELLAAKSGPAIVEEIYAFTDKGGREVGLRPELTPTLARMIAARAQTLKKPVRWYAVPQLFRYERTQRGRTREHIQWNVDLVGAPEIAADAEVLAVALDALRRLGLTSEHVHVRVFDRRITDRALEELGVKDRPAALREIDKGRSEDPALRAWIESPWEREGELGRFLDACADLGFRDWVAPDKRIVRGLAYYTGVVWEIFDRRRDLRAVAGGGRYDALIEKLGGPPMEAIGFGMGDPVLTELLTDLDLLPEEAPRLDALVVPIGKEMLGPARQVVRRLRDAGVSAEAPFTPLRLGKAFKAAEQAGARRVFLVGPDEWAEKMVKAKDLKSGKETVIALEELA